MGRHRNFKERSTASLFLFKAAYDGNRAVRIKSKFRSDVMRKFYIDVNFRMHSALYLFCQVTNASYRDGAKKVLNAS